MDNGFFSRFHPRVIDVVWRTNNYWIEYGKSTTNSVSYESTVTRNFLAVASGSGILIVNGTKYELSIGSVFYFPLRSRVQISYTSAHPMHFYSVHYDYKLLEWDSSSVSCLDPQEPNMPLPIVTQMSDIEGFLLLMRRTYDIWNKKDGDYQWQAQLLFLNMVNEVRSLNLLRNKGDLVLRAITRTMDYIKAHYAEPLEREELAEIAALSMSYFSIMFKRVAGCTPTQYITQIRLDKAKQLLQTSNKTVSEIAREVGFQDPLYFARVFANHAGMPPREYRKA